MLKSDLDREAARPIGRAHRRGESEHECGAVQRAPRSPGCKKTATRSLTEPHTSTGLEIATRLRFSPCAASTGAAS